MKILLLRLLLSGLLVHNAAALSDTTTNSDDQKASAQVAGGGGSIGGGGSGSDGAAKQLQSAQAHHIISCYACSTMDYENPNDNACRYMAKPVHRGMPLQVAPTLGHASSSSMMNYSPTPTPMSTSTSYSSSSSLTMPPPPPPPPPSSSSSLSSSDFSNSMPSQVASSSSWQDAAAYHNADLAATSGANLSTTRESAQWAQASNTYNSTTTTSGDGATGMISAPVRAANALAYNTPGAYLPHRIPLPPGNVIRTRTCLDDENFCSIVSVVRIEFSNDTLVSRFWAMERNCSKSCNTGCMLIGERVRLRVCSHCCRTPNCNIGNGAQVALVLWRIANEQPQIYRCAQGWRSNKLHQKAYVSPYYLAPQYYLGSTLQPNQMNSNNNRYHTSRSGPE